MLDTVEALLCERYNVPSLDGPLKDAIDAARSGGAVDPLRSLLSERELYRWREPIEAALAELDASPESVAAETPATPSAATEPDELEQPPEPTGVEPKEAADVEPTTEVGLDSGEPRVQSPRRRRSNRDAES